MAKKNSTKSELLQALKEAGVATKDDVKQIVSEEIESRDLATNKRVQDEVYIQLTEFYANMIKPDQEKLKKEMKDGFKKVNGRLDKVGNELHYTRDDVKGLKQDLTLTPSREEFEGLKQKVNRQIAN